uniref:BRCT domain-containing protein n=1 Tax=Vitis vinifera TaxID=29760 RepID=F6H0I2_VITVI
MMMAKSLKGANVFMSRNLVPPELFDSLHDALKLNGADVFLCCDPSRNGPNDYHIISSSDHEKFEDLRAKGCNLLGPQCVLSCAKEHRPLPKQGFTCCLAMDGVKVLASGFDMDEKVKIGKLVTAMGGVLHTKASSDWASNILKKPIVTINWLHQCWTEHRVVPQESYRVLPFSGLTICVTKIPADERKEMEILIKQNGGKYSADLTRNCTHLITDISSPEGDKYKVARRWGHIHIVTRKWFDQSIARKACVNEESYTVQGGTASSINSVRTHLTASQSQDKSNVNFQSASSSLAADSNLQAPAMQDKDENKLDGLVADDSQTEDSDLYLSDCRILLVGFEASEMRKLVNMVRRGGGSRYMSFNEKLTHIVVGTPSEVEKKVVRGLAATGVISVVRTIWLEDCDHEKKEVSVLRRHIAHDLLLPKDSACLNKGAVVGIINQGKSSTVASSMPADQSLGSMNTGSRMLLEKSKQRIPEVNVNWDNFLEETARSAQQSMPSINDKYKKTQQKMEQYSNTLNVKDGKESRVFKGKQFRFSHSFPEDRRAEIVQWVNQGGGDVVDDWCKQNVHFVVECHGALLPKSVNASQTTHVSSHWIRSCLEDGCLLDVSSHILYSPLPCQIPLPGFEKLRFCVSQYEEKDRLLLRNLCFVLGAKFVEKLTKKVTHLLCKFTGGPKYEAACKWGIKAVTSEWIYECIKQNGVVYVDSFCPKEITAHDRQAGLCIMSQYPTQAAQMISADKGSQLPTQSHDLGDIPTQSICNRSDRFNEEARHSSVHAKRARLLEDESQKTVPPSGAQDMDFISKMNSSGTTITAVTEETSHVVPDVAAAIEDLLEQTSKIHDLKSPGRTGCEKHLFSSDCSPLGQDHADSHSSFDLSKHWLNRIEKKDDICNPPGDVKASTYDGFSETQTESQVVGYEEDLSGRQMIIDRVRTRSSMC